MKDDLVISNLKRKWRLDELKRKRNMKDTEDKSSLFNRAVDVILTDLAESTRDSLDSSDYDFKI